MDLVRANADDILKKMKEEELYEQQGRLKIFFGYAAGVGKTYAMLKAAQAAKRRGVDVVLGYVEPHTRPETAALAGGLEQLPTLELSYKGITLREFNLDAAMKRKPALLIVDELAHTNAEGCRHHKRYQDIEELLKAGIDVYTTVNVQHIESLNDMVASVTGVLVRERIPDRVFDRSSQVELVDIEPQELIERLNHGKIYREGQAQKALEHFFDVKNLTALREIALRRCADRVNRMAEKSRTASESDYVTDEHILVCLSSSPTNAKIIRTGARMANAFRGSFTALFVETPEAEAMDEENRNRVRDNIRLAEQLGAAIETVYGDDVSFQIAEFARISGVSKIVLGRSNARQRRLFGKMPLTERLTVQAPNLDIYIIPDKEAAAYREKKAATKKSQPFSLADLVRSGVLLGIATVIGFLFFHLGFSEANIITVYILSVLLTAVLTSHRIYSMVSSLVSVLIFNYFFTDPRFTLNAYDAGYPATFLIMFVSAFITSSLAVKLKLHARQSAATAYRTKILLETNQLLQKSRVSKEIAAVTAEQLMKLLRRDVIFYFPKEEGLSEPAIFTVNGDAEKGVYTSENEKAVAAWVYKNNKHAGATTKTLGNSRCLYLAVRVNDTVYAVVGIAMEGEPPDAFESSIVLSILGECALALENEKTGMEREKAAIMAKNEQLRANLLRSISHDLRTPLTSISGNAGILLSSDEVIESSKRKLLYQDIYDDSLWLINLVENLLSVTRIEDGSMKLKLSTELMDEVVSEALRHVGRKAGEHQIRVIQPEEFLLAKMDARLIVQVIINIIDNAIKYTPSGSEIVVRYRKQGKYAMVEIADNGGGVAPEAKDKIFDMFYTAQDKIADSRRSLGMGLALCKSIITAHGGEIGVYDNVPQGTIFRFTLPAEEVNVYE